MRRSSGTAVVAAALGGGLLSGAAVALLAFLVARYGPVGGGWSFRGNGALAVYPLVLAALAGGWTGLALHRRADRRWPLAAIAAALVGVALLVVSAAALPLFGNGPLTGPVTVLGLVLAVGWAVVAPAWAWMRRPGGERAGGPGAGAHVAAGGAWALAVLAGLIVTGILVPAGS